MSEREERWLLRFIFVMAFFSLVAPIGGASLIEALAALLKL
ncbi:hypothetical protein [Aureimonas psammosilenae]|nr:hypothetical protein [Aureimonas psammosilenae]